MDLLDASDIIKQKKRKVVFAALRDNRLTGCTIENCVQTGTNCILQFKSYEEKLNYEKGKTECCGCISGVNVSG
jgi:hypothetical protein